MIDNGHSVFLKQVEDEDKALFYTWRNDPDIWEWCRQRGPITNKHHNKYWDFVETSDNHKFWAIFSKEDLQTIGCCGFTDIDHVNSRAEFSCYIDTSFQGFGYGTAALKTLFTYGFDYLNLNCIWGESYNGNPALSMFKKLGMKTEGKRRDFYFRNGRYIDAILISILRREWGH